MYGKKYPDRKKNELDDVIEQAKRKPPETDVLVVSTEREETHLKDQGGLVVPEPTRSLDSGSPIQRSNSLIQRGRQFYQMDHNRRGDFLIFNFNVYGENPRSGALKDTENLTKCFVRLGFNVTANADRTKEEMFRTINDCLGKDYSDADCFGMAILGHGKEGIINVKDGEVKLDNIIKRVKQCRNLKGKPKLFFVQSCRVYETKSIEADAEVNDYTPIVSIDSDLLISYATTKGNVAFRIPETGSPFITKLTDVLVERGTRDSILDLLTEVNAEVNRMVNEYGFTQITAFESTLNKKLVFDVVQQVLQSCKVYEDGRLEYTVSG